jgi:DNA repair ATPase RecN
MKHTTIQFIVPVFLSCMLMACSSSSPNEYDAFQTKSDSLKSYDTVSSTVSYAEVQSEAGALQNTVTNVNQANTAQKLIKQVSLEMESTDFESDINSIKNQVITADGYIESLSLTGNSVTDNDAARDADMVIRIPESKLDEFLNEAETIGNISYKNEEITDITLQYVDVEEHLESLRQEQDRLSILMDKADDIEDILQIEARLSEIRYQVESYASQLKVYENQVNYATIDLSITEVKTYTTQARDGFLTRISNGLKHNFDFISHFIIDMVVLLVSSIPTIIVFGLLIIIGQRLIRHIGQKGKKKNKSENNFKIEK